MRPIRTITEKDPVFRHFFRVCVQEYTPPYGVQQIKGEWSTRQQFLSDPLLLSHLRGDYWVGKRAGWYPSVQYFDLDAPKDPMKAVECVAESLELTKSQYLVCSSPSYRKDGSCHIFICGRYKEDFATKRLLMMILQPRAKKLGAEVYPQTGRIFRLPFGRDQHILNEAGDITHLSLAMSMIRIEGLENFELSTISHPPQQQELPIREKTPYKKASKIKLPIRSDIAGLLEYGLQAPGTRHIACGELSRWCYRQNMDPDEAKLHIKEWLTRSHHGFSKEILAGRWTFVYREIDDWVRDTYIFLPSKGIFPDGPHNSKGFATVNDLKLVARTFPADLTQQRRFYNLIYTVRPFIGYREWVFISAKKWADIASGRHLEIIEPLKKGNLLESIDTYQPGSFSKRYRLNVDKASSNEGISCDGRYLDDYIEALKTLGPAEAVELTGIQRRNLYR